MADFEHREGGMTIFKNSYKEKENQPDYKGEALIDGKKKQVSCWIKQGKNGKFFSCQVQDPYKPAETTAAEKAHINNDFDDDIPF